ncbi:hypothetical protein GEMRC1_004845 [Eukaryota sp. GEM-RC1]
MFKSVFLLAVLAVVVSCKSCSFEVNDKFYDLSSLNKNDLVWDKPYSQTQWFFRACSPVSEKCGSYKNAALCEKDDNGNHHSGGGYDKATAKALPEKDKSGLAITYKDGDVGCGGVARSTTVMCFCDASKEGEIEDMNEYPPCTYEMAVYSKHCCETSKPSSIFPKILLGTVIVVILYFVGGFLFMFFVKKERGAAAIPNVQLWQSVGSSISGFFSFVAAKTFKRSQYTQV